VVLSLPAVGLIRAHFPDAKISFLGTQYTQALLEDCSDINDVWNWTALQHEGDEDILAKLKSANIDAIIFLRYVPRLAKLAKKAGIPMRIGKIRFFKRECLYYNRWRIRLSFVSSHQHESQWNVGFLKPLGIRVNLTLPQLATYIHLKSSTRLSVPIDALLNKQQFNLILHPGSNGNGCEWPISHFQQLIQQLSEKFQDKIQIFLTGSEAEAERFQPLIKASPAAINMMGKMTLPEFITFISRADGIVVSGTGPLHIGAALGIKTLGLFPPRRRIGLAQWAPVGKQAEGIVCEHKKLCQDCPGSQDCFCMAKIKVDRVARVVEEWLCSLA
jgi:ADP-heptose:LPS heptosyltransferase